MRIFRSLFRRKLETIIIVSGLPRSGTSMMMKALKAGGVELLTDSIRKPNDDNPKGYYEFEPVKSLADGNTAWVDGARGKAVKVISALLKHLPATYSYKVLFMRRNIDEILASQRKMLDNQAKPAPDIDDDQMTQMLKRHLEQVYRWLDQQPNFEYLDVDYNLVLQNPPPIFQEINQFLGYILDTEEMAAEVDPTLYRQRQQ